MKTRLAACLPWVSVPIALLVSVTGFAGLFWRSTYARETPQWAAEAMGGDAVNLFIIVPLLLISAWLMRRNSIAAHFTWLGSLGYLFYNFLIYCFAVHFNSLFLVYCAALALSFYGFIIGLISLVPSAIAESYNPSAPIKTTAVVFLLMAVVTAFQWTREIITALTSGHLPPSVTDIAMPVNPIWVLDLCFLLPALAITAIMLLRKRPLAFVLAPTLLTVLLLISCELVGIAVAMIYKGLWHEYGPLGFFLALIVGFTALLIAFLRAARPTAKPDRTKGMAASGF